MKTNQERKIRKFKLKALDIIDNFVENIVCYPLNVLEKKNKIKNNRNKPIYEYLLIPDKCFQTKSQYLEIKR